MDKQHRISWMDGHRGLAILLVILYHAYARWPDLVPYGNQYGSVPLVEFGWLGVELFFLVSGFVILMTLEKCRGIREFLYRRWIRLFPAMLIASALVFLTATFFHERPGGIPSLASLLPGLTFVDIKWWQLFTGMPKTPLEGAFWSLYVEFKFYVVAGFVYFLWGRNTLLATLVGAYVLSALSVIAGEYFPGHYAIVAGKACSALGITYFGWFAAGAMFYLYHKNGDRKWFGLATTMAILSALVVRKLEWQPALAAILISALFAGSLVSSHLQALLNNRILQFYGLISYPLYLIHENMLIAMIVKLGQQAGDIPQYLLPVLPIMLLSATAYLIVRFAEPVTRAGIRKTLG